MNAVPVTEIYDYIIEYYENTDYKKLISKILNSKSTLISNGKVIIEFDPPDEDEALFRQEKAFRIFKSDDEMETDLETTRKYLTMHFAYLMKNVFCLDLKLFRMGKTFAVPEQDVPIVKEILLRSVSQHDFDLIIGRWLKGKIKDDSYADIYELSKRLFHLIRSIPDVEQERKDRWITALRMALRSDLAYAVSEAEYLIQEVFSYSLTFVPKGDGFDPQSFLEEKIAEEMYSFLNDLAKRAEDESRKAIYQYLQSADYERMTSPEAFPPVELLEMKSVCEYMYESDYLKDIFPNANQVDIFTNYFLTIDKAFAEKRKARKRTDQQRYQRKKSQNKL